MTERIAGVSLLTIVCLLAVLTAARSALYATRTAALRTVGDLLESVILAVALVFLVLRPFVVQSFFIPSGSMHPTLWEGDHILVNKWVYRTHPPKRGDVVVFRAPKEAAPDEKEFIKRVIGVPGDTITIQAGYVTVGATTFTRNEIRACMGEQLSVDQIADLSNLPPLHLTREAIFLGNRRVTPEEFALATGHAGLPARIEPGRVLLNGEMLMECYVAEDTQYGMTDRYVPSNCLFVMGDNRNQSLDSHVWGTLPIDRVIGRADVVFWPVRHVRLLGPQ